MRTIISSVYNLFFNGQMELAYNHSPVREDFLRLVSYMLLFIGLILMQATGARASTFVSADQQTVKVENRQTATATVTQKVGFVQSDQKEAPGGFIARNWGILTLSLLGFFDVIARLTPTEKDNTILNFLSNILNVIIPNFKKGGGRL